MHQDISHLVGRSIKGKVFRQNHPVMVGKIKHVRDALMGNVRVVLEDGSEALMEWPPQEIIKLA